MNIQEKCIKLQEFIRYYQPKGYREQIHVFSATPSVLEHDYIELEQAYKNNTLETVALNLCHSLPFGKLAWHPFDKTYILEAINTYFDRECQEKGLK